MVCAAGAGGRRLPWQVCASCDRRPRAAVCATRAGGADAVTSYNERAMTPFRRQYKPHCCPTQTKIIGSFSKLSELLQLEPLMLLAQLPSEDPDIQAICEALALIFGIQAMARLVPLSQHQFFSVTTAKQPWQLPSRQLQVPLHSTSESRHCHSVSTTYTGNSRHTCPFTLCPWESTN